MEKDVNNVQVHYLKSNQFRLIHAEGVFGGISPTNMIHFALYNDRLTIPKTTSVEITPTGTYENVEETIGGIVREVEANVFINLGTAISFKNWLNAKIETLRQGLDIPDDEWAEYLSSFQSGRAENDKT
jgi:hypothetical protein